MAQVAPEQDRSSGLGPGFGYQALRNDQHAIVQNPLSDDQ